MRTRLARSAAFVSAVVCLVAGTLAAVVPNALAAAGDVTVTWPQATAFNPDTTTYAVDIESDGSWTYLLRGWEQDGDLSAVQDFTEPGQHEVEFNPAANGGDIVLNLLRCNPDKTGCVLVSQSPELHVWRRLDVRVPGTNRGPRSPVPLGLEPAAPDRVDVDWDVLDQGTVVASGTYGDIPYTSQLPALDPVPNLVDGRSYELRVTVSGVVAPYGPLTGEGVSYFSWDSTPDRGVTVGIYWSDVDKIEPMDSFYPVPDGYGDRLRIEPRSNQISRMNVQISAPDGGVVFDSSTQVFGPGSPFEWDGLDSSGQLLPEGTYHAKITLDDWSNNEAVEDRDIELSHAQPTRRVWRGVITPKKSVDYISNRRCGEIHQPARRNWPGSMAFRSHGCWAYTWNTIDVPYSVTHRYGRARLIVVGGAPDGQSPLYYQLVGSNGIGAIWDYAPWTGPELGQHVSEWQDQVVRARDDGTHAEVAWGVATDHHHSYDVKKFIVKVEYDVIE